MSRRAAGPPDSDAVVRGAVVVDGGQGEPVECAAEQPSVPSGCGGGP
ncbi:MULTISPECIES: hypothetical protein [unclassified Streptomyces]